MALTGKKRLFADAVLAGSTNKEAAIAAGYSPATAAQSGSRMAKDTAIAAHIAEHRGTPPAKPVVPAAVRPAVPPKGDEPASGDVGKLYTDPADYLMDQMNDPALDPRDRRDAAKALMPFKHQKLGEGGKKDQKQDAAKTAARGKFAPAAAPKLVVNNK